MYIGFVTRLLFCVALLTQIGAPLAGAAAVERGGAFQTFCRILHDGDATGALAAANDSQKAPRSEHGHHDCPLCTLGASAALAAPEGLADWARIANVTRLSPRPTASTNSPRRLRIGAAPRAPPFPV
jgi:hypothetical protein